MEKSQEVMVQAVADVQDSIKDHEDALNSYKDQLDDYENRDRRQNIRIKGLSEIIYIDWRTYKVGAPLQQPEQWQQVSPRGQRRNRQGRQRPT